jgi:hypothetical protein
MEMPLTANTSRQQILNFALQLGIFIFAFLICSPSPSAADTEGRFDPAVFAREELPERTAFKKVVSLPGGRTWAITNSWPGKLLERADGQWREADWKAGIFTAGQVRGFLDAAAGTDDGLWLLVSAEQNKKFFAVKWNGATRRAEFARELPFEKADAHEVRVHPAPDGSLWVTANDPRVFRLAADGAGEWREVFRATDAMLFTESPPARFTMNPLTVVFDGAGAAWIAAVDGASNRNTLRGLARVAGGETRWFEKFDGLPGGMLELLAPVTVGGRHELWLTVLRGGTHRLRLDTLAVTPLEFPDDTKINPVWEAFTVGGAVWAVNGRGIFAMMPVSDRIGALWRMNADGGWEKKVDGLDSNSVFHNAEDRPRLAADGGLWLASRGRGVWWVPADGAAVNLDWTKGFPASHPTGLFADGAGRLAVTGWNFGQAHHFEIARALALPATSPRSLLTVTGEDVAQAADGALFTTNRYARALRQWTRDGWRDIPFADELEVDAPFPPTAWLGTDSRNRVWLIPGDADRYLTRVWNIDRQKWDAPRPYLELIAGAANTKPDWHFLFSIRNSKSLHYRREAVFDRHGRAAFIHRGEELRLFDGRGWRKVTKPDFPAEDKVWFYELQNDAADGGILARVGEKKWYRLGLENQWTPLADGDRPRSRESFLSPLAEKQNRTRPPEWRGLPVHSLTAADGEECAVADEKLHRRRHGRLVAWMDEGQAKPFVGILPMGMVMDQFGRRVFFDWKEMVTVSDHPPEQGFAPVPADVEVARPSIDAVNLCFTGALADGDNLRWRRFGDDWSAWGTDLTLTVQDLLLSEYAVEIQKIDPWLNVSPLVSVKFFIKYDVEKLVRSAVKKLFSKNWGERNLAVKSLARFPKESRVWLAKLDSNREKFSEVDCWWLDATLQRVNDDNRR